MECANKVERFQLGPARGQQTPTEKSCCQSFCRQRANTSGHLGRGVAGLVRLRRTGTGAGPKGASIGISVLQGFHIDGFQLVQLRLPAFGLRGRARATAAAEEELEGGVRLSRMFMGFALMGGWCAPLSHHGPVPSHLIGAFDVSLPGKRPRLLHPSTLVRRPGDSSSC
ncbi:hypothetical protein B0T13DRAFT_469243 [Neurospora crassa]|nr:hypothetical protein B0T13DRAFT_469243 [Neurospora crassa]